MHSVKIKNTKNFDFDSELIKFTEQDMLAIINLSTRNYQMTVDLDKKVKDLFDHNFQFNQI